MDAWGRWGLKSKERHWEVSALPCACVKIRCIPMVSSHTKQCSVTETILVVVTVEVKTGNSYNKAKMCTNGSFLQFVALVVTGDAHYDVLCERQDANGF